MPPHARTKIQAAALLCHRRTHPCRQIHAGENTRGAFACPAGFRLRGQSVPRPILRRAARSRVPRADVFPDGAAQRLMEIDREQKPGPVVSDFLYEKDKIFAYINLENEELKIYEMYYEMLAASVAAPDLVIYLQAKPEVLRQRI